MSGKKKVRFLSKEKKTSWKADFREFPVDLPLYLSIDKDVLCPEDACTTWSQGEVTLEELTEYLEMILGRMASCGQQAVGIDICGECDPDQMEGCDVNDRANRVLLELFAGKE